MYTVKFKMGTGPGSWQSKDFADYGAANHWAESLEARGYEVRVV